MTRLLSVVVPCFNEAGNLRELTARTLRVFDKMEIEGEIVLVDDGSEDGTAGLVDELAAAEPRVVPVHHEVNRGIEVGWRSGIGAASGVFVCLIDADLQNLPEDIPRLYRELVRSNVDLVQGFRSSVGRKRGPRYFWSRGLNFLLNVCFGMYLPDNKSGFALARREVLEDVISHRLEYRYYQAFIAVAADAKGYSIRQIETLFEDRRIGSSFLSGFPLAVVFWCFVDLAKALWEFRLAPKREALLAQYLSENPPARSSPAPRGARRLLFELFFLTMPLHKWLIGRQAKHYYLELIESQWLEREQIRELQEIKLRRLVAHAYHHVGFYRERMDAAGLTPEDVRTLDDLEKLPLLGKDDVRENLYFELLSDNHDKRRILKVTTSGSTGEPFVCYADQHQLEQRWASTLRSLEWTGYRFGDRCARIWHQTIGMSWSQVFRERLDALLQRRAFVPAFRFSEANVERFVERLRRHRPVLIDGYAESFNLLARVLEHRKLTGLRPLAVVSSAQTLPDQSRAIIEETFGCEVFDKYGSREFSGIAYECEAHDGHHVVAESYVVELLRDGRPAAPGELGEVIVTDLNNFCMPLIRYRVGDLAVAMDDSVPCACGRGLPRIGRIEGRVQAIILGSGGSFLPGSFFAHFLKDYDHVVRQYQVVQEVREAITFKVVKALRFSEEAFEEIMATLREYLGSETRIEVEFVDEIELGRTGKHQVSVSRLEIDFQDGVDVRSGRS